MQKGTRMPAVYARFLTLVVVVVVVVLNAPDSRPPTRYLIISLDLDQSRLIVSEPVQRFRVNSVDWFRCID